MKIWKAISDALAGWMLILRGEAGWRGRFSLTTPGLLAALAIYAFMTFLAVALASMSIGMPSIAGILAAMFVLALPVIALVLTLLGTRSLLKSAEPVYPVLIPGIYALTVFLVVEGVLAMIGGPVVILAWLALGYLLYRLVRAATGWNIGIAAGFAVLTVVLLVAMRMALYMLSNPAF
ncbi:hypothetical protein [Devosia psychrophila]|uniref:Yip1 domain-containing protein n=1 Tax=Devosia psychrophila TaxID=728005 RepID=A0A0F5PXK7_9HYPH|nr:hypothetical protein [Devosia psychrophila]KKC33355.1 hypothetical protein WH91_10100 [Devosia psychrophila]SFC20833.1 hypothetical protein SAMN04488059_10322 [Devosia psychrophila]